MLDAHNPAQSLRGSPVPRGLCSGAVMLQLGSLGPSTTASTSASRGARSPPASYIPTSSQPVPTS